MLHMAPWPTRHYRIYGRGDTAGEPTESLPPIPPDPMYWVPPCQMAPVLPCGGAFEFSTPGRTSGNYGGAAAGGGGIGRPVGGGGGGSTHTGGR